MSPELIEHRRQVYRARRAQQRLARPRQAWMETINRICRRHRVMFEDVCTTSRIPAVVPCRQEIWWTLRQAGATYYDMGKRFGFHHTTIMHGVEAWGRCAATQMN